MFVRELDEKITSKLKDSKLFNDKLLPDIENGSVYPAIRNNRVDFYHEGGKLFGYDGKFKTHFKYASAIISENDYLTEEELGQAKVIKDFSQGYERIKKNCALYAGIESKGVSRVYRKYHHFASDSDIVVLDIEVSLESINEKKSQERIDVLLFNKKTQELRFYEAKHFTNSELWARKKQDPKVRGQIKGYEKLILEEKSEIVSQYSKYVGILKDLFGCKLPEPENLDDKVALLMFGFDRDQLSGKIRESLLGDGSLDDIKYYFKGDISSVVIDNLWKSTKIAVSNKRNT